MKQKVGTTIDGRLLRRAKEYCVKKEVPLNFVIEEALDAYLSSERDEETLSLEDALRMVPGSHAIAGTGEGAGDIADEDFD